MRFDLRALGAFFQLLGDEQNFERFDVARLRESARFAVFVARELERGGCGGRVANVEKFLARRSQFTSPVFARRAAAELRDQKRGAFSSRFVAHVVTLRRGCNGLRVVTHAHALIGLRIATKNHDARRFFGSAREAIELDGFLQFTAKLRAMRRAHVASPSRQAEEPIEDAHACLSISYSEEMIRWRSIHVMSATIAVVVAACGGRSELDGANPVTTDSGPQDVAEAGRPTIKQSSKLDMLFAIDNSPSMGDKQALLLTAIPLFLERLTNPWCISTDPTIPASPSNNGVCLSGLTLEFPPITDIHIGIVSSSLGSGGAPDTCPIQSTGDVTHQDDHGHLLNRTRPASQGAPEGSVLAANPIDGSGGNFLAWTPATEKQNVTDEPSESQLESDFGALVNGVQEHGCGLEAQLESWYRFLVQPDPYQSLALSSDSPPKVSLSGVDSTLLKQRHDFLRPDSLLLIMQITDEDDSWSDPSWLGGYGWTPRTNNFPGGPGQGAGPRGTSECDATVNPNSPTTTGPNDPDCVSCAFPASTKPVAGTPISQDPNCNACAGGTSNCPQKGWYTPAAPSIAPQAADGLNVRYTNDMRRRYGIDPQWNVGRYVDGLTSLAVPDRTGEIHDASAYASTQKNCTNPLFASALPDGSDTTPATLCNLTLGERDPSLVYYLIIGGVPWQLLAQDPFNTSLPLKQTLASSDWTKIVGTDPSTYQLDGIDPHMIESVLPRPGLPPPTSSDTADPENGREWNTLESNSAIDLQFACVFDLLTPKDCTSPEFLGACDCIGPATAADGPPLCDPVTRTLQTRGKAYPTIRELRVAQGLANQGVVASICPRVNAASYFEVHFSRIRNSVPQK